MLTDTALRNLKPKPLTYKVSDRDGMYVTVSPANTVTFRYDYRLNGRRETLTIGRYGAGGISLAMARELLLEARKAVLQGVSPALEKQRDKRRVRAIKTFGAAMETYLAHTKWADSTRAVRKHIIDRDILPVFQNRLLTEIQAEDLRILCNKVKERGAPATAVQIRDIVKQVYVYAIAHGEKVVNPADSVGPSSIATFVPKDVPLDPLRLGSNSTRTTHPYYMARWNDLLVALGIDGEIRNPYWDKTKGEMAAACRNPDLLKKLATDSLSCSSPAKARWLGHGIEQCGYCLPCLIRRAALAAAWGTGNDPTTYTVPDLHAQPLDTRQATGVQVRSFQYAIERLKGKPQLANLLIHKPGSLADEAAHLDQLADVYRRGLGEVAQLIDGAEAKPS